MEGQINLPGVLAAIAVVCSIVGPFERINMRYPTFAAPTICAALMFAPGVTAQGHPISFPNAVAAGDVDSDSAVLWAAVDRPAAVLFEVSRTPGFHFPVRLAFDFVPSPAQPAKADVCGLQPDTRYYYRALVAGRSSLTGTFRTTALPGTQRGLRFGVSGDWRGELAPYPAVRNADQRLDFFVALGDTIYADYPSPAVPLPQASTLAQYRAKHREVYGSRFGLNALGDLRRATAWFATIDDHEVTNDFAGGAPPASDPRFLPSNAPFINGTPLYQRGLRAFVDYNPIGNERYHNTNSARFDGAPRLYRHRRCGDDAALFVLDARSFRDTELPGVSNPNNPAEIFQFLVSAFDTTRTMLGSVQFAQLRQDLLAAQQAGVTWKFVFVPEPIQNLGVIGASDRFEGYAAERTALLSFIVAQGIQNVVFVTADLHGTFVNNLTYSNGPGQAQIATGAFEVITGAVAFDAPLGPSLIEIGALAGLLTPAQVAFYQSLPRAGKDAFVRNLVDSAITPLGYDPLGLEGSPIDATLEAGSYVATHTYGWTEFQVDANDQSLRIITWGIDPYTDADLLNPATVTNRQPAIVQQFVVRPQ